MNDRLLTVYEKLEEFEFKKENSYYYDDDSDPNRVLAKVKGKDEYEKKLRELKQQKRLKKVYNVFRKNLKDRILSYETTRYARYFDYDLMERHPIIGGALNILMEESTTLDENGQMLNIYSKNERVKKELTKLFYNNLKIHTSLPMWTKTMVKYGDAFLYLKLDDTKGVVGAEILPTIEVERVEWENESARFDSILNSQRDNEYFYGDVFFRWVASREAEIPALQVAHFRLLEDDKTYPYGTSSLDKARMIWQNLILVEDAMRMTRLIRGMDRKIFYLYVGNTESGEAQKQMIQNLMEGHQSVKHVDPKTGQLDKVYNVMQHDQDYIIPVTGKDDATKIESLAGASNIDQIADIEYDLNQLFAALGIPKPFLTYEESSGEGKNLAMQDIRFARKINRIQQAVLMELNKIAIRHLILIGQSEFIDDFELSLNNPSIQSKQQQIDLLERQSGLMASLYREADDNGISTLSYSEAMKKVFNYSDEKIKEILYQQYFEREVFTEFQRAPDSIQSNYFKDLIEKFPVLDKEVQTGDGDEEGGLGGGGGFGGGGDMDMDMDLDGGDEGEFDEGSDDLDLDIDTGGEESVDDGGEDIEI